MAKAAERVEDGDGQPESLPLHPDDAGACLAAVPEDVGEVRYMILKFLMAFSP